MNHYVVAEAKTDEEIQKDWDVVHFNLAQVVSVNISFVKICLAG